MILGLTGAGKSTLLKWLLMKIKKPIYIYDSEYEHRKFKENMVIIRPKQTYDIYEFEVWNKYIWRQGNLVYAIENIDFFAKSYKPLPFYFAKLVGLGRKKGIGLIMTTRRIADVHKTPCSQVKHWFLFKTFLPNDIKYLKQFIGDIANELANLDNHEFIYYRVGQKPKKYKPLKVMNI